MVSLQIKRIETELSKLREQKLAEEAAQKASATPKPAQAAETKRYECEITNYAWDQSDKFVKLFISLQGAHEAGEDNVTVEFKKNAILLRVANLQNRDHVFAVNNLLHEIDLEGSYRKVKTNAIAIYAKKSVESELDDGGGSSKVLMSLSFFAFTEERWEYLTVTEKRVADAKKSALKTDDQTVTDDPNGGLMKVMQQMYESGDSDMKRMIAKAWTEGQDKQQGPKIPF